MQDCSRAELDAWVEANAAAVRDHGAADLLYVNHVLLGGAVGAATGGRYVVKAHGSELEYSMRGNAELSAWGGEVARRRGGDGRRLRAHPRGRARRLRHGRARPRDPARRRRRPVAPRAARDRARRARRRGAPRPAEPRQRQERLPDDANAERLAAFLAGERHTVVYFGKLMENKGVQVLLDALRDLDARAVIVGFGDRRAELEAPGRGPRRALHRPARAPPPRAPAGARRRRGRAVDLPGGLRHGRRRGRGRRLPADRRRPLGPGRDRPRAWRRSTRPRRAGLASFPNGDAAALHERLRAVLALDGDERDALRTAARRAVVERWSWSSVAERIAALATP